MMSVICDDKVFHSPSSRTVLVGNEASRGAIRSSFYPELRSFALFEDGLNSFCFPEVSLVPRATEFYPLRGVCDKINTITDVSL